MPNGENYYFTDKSLVSLEYKAFKKISRKNSNNILVNDHEISTTMSKNFNRLYICFKCLKLLQWIEILCKNPCVHNDINKIIPLITIEQSIVLSRQHPSFLNTEEKQGIK